MSDAPEVTTGSTLGQPSQADLDLFKKVLPKLSPLSRAVYDGDWRAVQSLVRQGARLDEVQQNVPTPLAVAVTLQRREMITFLLESGADANVHGGALLVFAVSRRDLETARALLDHGATVGAQGHGRTALGFAAQLGLTEAIDLLLERGAPLEGDEGNGFTPLLLAATEGHIRVAIRLITAGANVNAVSKRGRTAISLAAGIGNVEMVQALVGAGANLESTGETWTPLTAAAGGGHVTTVSELLRLGADPNGPSQKIWTPLVVAAYNGRVEAIRVLLAAGADPDRRDGKGRTALMWASWRQFRGCDEILRAAGADPALVAPEDVTPRSVEPIPRITRSKGIRRNPWLVRVMSSVMQWGTTRRTILGFSIAVDIPKERRTEAFVVVERALRLIEQYAPTELGRLRTAFQQIIVAEVPLFQAAYFHDQKWCVLNWDPKAKAPRPSKVAALFVHEATHHRLHRCGFGARQTELLRVERACSRAALRFARRLPGSSGLQVASDHLHGITPDSLSHEAERERVRRHLKGMGARWAIPFTELLLRWKQRWSERG